MWSNLQRRSNWNLASGYTSLTKEAKLWPAATSLKGRTSDKENTCGFFEPLKQSRVIVMTRKDKQQGPEEPEWRSRRGRPHLDPDPQADDNPTHQPLQPSLHYHGFLNTQRYFSCDKTQNVVWDLREPPLLGDHKGLKGSPYRSVPLVMMRKQGGYGLHCFCSTSITENHSRFLTREEYDQICASERKFWWSREWWTTAGKRECQEHQGRGLLGQSKAEVSTDRTYFRGNKREWLNVKGDRRDSTWLSRDYEGQRSRVTQISV